MKLSFNTWVYSSFPVWVPAYPLDVVIERIARIGYDAIEIGCAAPHAWPDHLPPARRKEIRRKLEAAHLALSSMLPAPGGGPGHNTASPLAEERAGAIEHYGKVVRLCAELGGRIVVYVAGWQVFGTPRGEAWAWSREALSAIARDAEQQGVTIVVEPTSADSNLVESCDDGITMMREVGAPNVKLMFDTYHAHYRNEVSSDYVWRYGKDLKHVHFADSDRLAPGDGKVDFVSVVEALKAVGFDGYITMEIGFNRRGVEPDAIARRALAYTKSILRP